MPRSKPTPLKLACSYPFAGDRGKHWQCEDHRSDGGSLYCCGCGKPMPRPDAKTKKEKR